jgi:hypothetical protein
MVVRYKGGVMTKGWLQSKTFWLAIVQGAVGVVGVLATQYPEAGWALMAKSVLDVVLRKLTSKPIA